MHYRFTCKDIPGAYQNIEITPDDDFMKETLFDEVIKFFQDKFGETHIHVFKDWTFAMHPDVNQNNLTVMYICPGKDAV